jgi:hypothetical protein
MHMWSEFFMSKPKTRTKSTAKSKAKAKSRTAKKPARVATAKSAAAASPRADWRQKTLARMRALILEADPEMVEERKWAKKTTPDGVPVFSHDGIVCTGETYQKVVKLTFMHGASLPDPAKLFNAGFDGNVRRAIDIPEGATVDAAAFKALIRAAVARNSGAK